MSKRKTEIPSAQIRLRSMKMSDSNTEIKSLIGYLEDEEKGRGFEPIPYTFKIPDKWKKVGESSIISPPNWLLLDHTIAVIWYLFSTLTPNKVLDIDDLKWAHEFLKDVRNVKGDHPPDVKTCLMEIQDRLIALYAQLTRTREDSTEQTVEQPVPLPRQKTDSIETSKITKKKDTKYVRVDNKASFKDIKSEPSGIRKQTKDAPLREQKKVLIQQKRVSPNRMKNSPISGKRNETSKNETGKKEGEVVHNYFTQVFERNRMSDRVLGANTLTNTAEKKGCASDKGQVKEIISNGAKTNLTQREANDEKISLEFKRWVTEEELNGEEQAYRNLKNEIQNLMKNPKISKDEVLKFLSNWREQQFERLQSELKRLSSIEEFMKSVQMEGFVPYVDDDLARKLTSLACKKKTSLTENS